MRNIRLAAFDLDGTALLQDHCSFSIRFLKDLDLLHRRGIEILPVTGRPAFMIPEALKKAAPWHHLIICANGAEIRELDSERILFCRCIPSETVKKIVERALQYDIPCEFHTDMHAFVSRADAQKESHRSDLQFHYQNVVLRHAVIVEDLKEVWKEHSALKGVLMPQNETETALIRKILQGLPVYDASTGVSFHEISAEGITKGAALKRVCDLLGVSMESVFYIGDSWNDLSAMKAAGISAAMGSAPPDIRKMCTMVTKDNRHEGAALALEKIL